MKWYALIFFTLLMGCQQQTLEIQAEHLTNEELKQQLMASSHLRQLAEGVGLELINDGDQSTATAIRLSGSSNQISQIIQIATALDKPNNYYLVVRNTDINSISTQGESMRVLLHPDQKITLGHLSLLESPWKAYIIDRQKYVELELNSNLVLKIVIKSQDDGQLMHYSGVYPLQLGQWNEVFSEGLGNTAVGKKKGNRKDLRVSTANNQLWLRLDKAGSQSELNN